jgi:UDP-N-acetylglucosamine 2-epimerase (non-hydrolysing)
MPEEINRIVTDALADLLLTPSPDADANLLREGIPRSRICFVGNVMIDSLVANLPRARESSIAQRLGLVPQGYALVTLHRPSNVDDESSLQRIMAALIVLAERQPVVFPAHPRTRAMLERFRIPTLPIAESRPALRLIDPVGYHDSLWLTAHARFVLTDSGGIQEESTFLGTPCLTLRPNTERPITIEIGTNRLTCVERLQQDIAALLRQEQPTGRIPELWDGQAAGRIVDALVNHGARPAM